ncbi:serine hydrolase domain-containing protein [Xylanimonas ulmi]|uniref:CubicO group peptidase (Beta-lactamase class C family) n=1 Tax=Xylanimonas ulmi TaxID=228973 RepID=A0A4Q7M1U8_9MICO|nr:serine hydrolase domain-containing protein [Xylanibacterium ulmi]RZS61826.1 CubicO group peptidase (beta-lactamase class C family) [Xylanibacterium ulmi]
MSRTSLPSPACDALTSALAAQRRAGRLPAASAAVARGGQVVWAAADGVADASGGPVGPEHAFRIGSITKTMVAVSVLRLAHAGALTLEDAVGAHLPDAPAPDATLAQVLSHTAGLPAEPDGPWWERAGGRTWDEVARHRPITPPGERFHYSNLGFAVLGRLLEQVHGRPWDQVLRAEVWEPLGMTSTARVPTGPRVAGFAVHPHADLVHAEPVADYGVMGAAGEVWSTPSDLARLGSWLVAAGPDGAWSASDDAVLPVAARRRMCAPRALRDEPGAAWTAAYGLGVMVWDCEHGAGDAIGAARDVSPDEDGLEPGRRRRTAGHGGSVPGFQAALRADVETGDVVAMCSSSTAGAYDPVALLDVLDAHAPRPAPTAPDDAAADALALTGTWYWGPAPYTVRLRRGGLLELTARGGRGTAFARAGAGEWVGVEGGYWLGETLRPVERDGRTVALDVGTFCFTRSPYAGDTDLPGGPDPDGWRPLPAP